ncbi:MAG: ABC transporter substrate-binding protein [Pseudomonadota bacterium]
MSRLIVFFLGLWLTACSGTTPPQASGEKPMRIVSLDFCSDQYVLKFADPEQILAVSPDAVAGFSFMRDEAVGVPTVRPLAEDVLILKPDLVVRSYGGGPNAAAFFERAGIPVLQVGWASSIDGEDLGSIPSLIQSMADGLGQSERGHVLVTEYRDRLNRIKARQTGDNTLYMTPAGYTTGSGSLAHDMMIAAGLTNFQKSPGWRSLPLERLAYEQPDMVAAAYFDTLTNHADAWSAARHPVAQKQLKGPDTVSIKGAWLACGGWFIVNGIEALAESAAE